MSWRSARASAPSGILSEHVCCGTIGREINYTASGFNYFQGKLLNAPTWVRAPGPIPDQVRVSLHIHELEVIRYLAEVKYGQMTAELNRLLLAGLIALQMANKLEQAGQEIEHFVAVIREILPGLQSETTRVCESSGKDQPNNR